MPAIGNRLRAGLAAVLLAALATAPGARAAGEERRVKIINETNNSIVRFYASTVEEASWEADILGRDVLRPRQSVTIDLDDGSGACLYDFKAVFDDGEELVRKGINVCEIESYRYTAD